MDLDYKTQETEREKKKKNTLMKMGKPEKLNVKNEHCQRKERRAKSRDRKL